ncbi:MAG: Asp23/Gls24 family envelope stress response protein, partial [Microbacteriaceae bacterium]
MSQNTTAPTVASTGKTTIVDPVVAKLAGIAAREVPGVHALGAGAARLVGNIREAIGNKDL